MKYKQLTVSTTHEFADIVSLCLCDAGSEGANVFDAEDFKSVLNDFNWDYIDENFLTDTSKTVLVSGYFDVDFDTRPIIEELENLRSNSCLETGSLETVEAILESDEWENVWKDYYKPIKIGRISVVPKWLKPIHQNTVPVYINPGMAFGTGSHETTAMCIRLMQLIDVENKTAADVGCGSGILGICALRLGAKSCTFVDFDPNAIKATEENCNYNGIKNKSDILLGSLLSGEVKVFDIVLANLTADILTDLFESIDKHLTVGGKIIISGIINIKLKGIKQMYLSKSFKCLKALKKGDWHAMLLEKI